MPITYIHNDFTRDKTHGNNLHRSSITSTADPSHKKSKILYKTNLNDLFYINAN